MGLEGNMSFESYAWREHIGQYGYHNVDSPAQKATLLAGAGTVAHRIAQQTR